MPPPPAQPPDSLPMPLLPASSTLQQAVHQMQQQQPHQTPCPALSPVQENVAMMDEYLPLSQFKAVYIVDLCHSLCEQVRQKGSRHCAD